VHHLFKHGFQGGNFNHPLRLCHSILVQIIVYLWISVGGDHGSSAVVGSAPAKDYTAETALRKVASVLAEQGCPDRIRLDRDPRWVGSGTAKDIPLPMLRFLQCLGVDPQVCPP